MVAQRPRTYDFKLAEPVGMGSHESSARFGVRVVSAVFPNWPARPLVLSEDGPGFRLARNF